MSDAINRRKEDHIRVIREDPATDRRKFYFDAVHLVHRALPEIDFEAVDTSTTFLGKRLRVPLMISCMTGGAGEELHTINRNLAIAAERAGVAMGVGSQRVMFSDPAAVSCFVLREYAPTIPLISNLGAVQLNNGVTIDQCREAVGVVGADALCLHLNPLQEAVQPGGDTNFGNLAARIHDVVEGLPVPVIVKEVGAGIGPRDAELLLQAGVACIDVAGAGGTSWSRIEYHRDEAGCSPGKLFQDWGLPTPTALRLLHPYRDRVQLMASGGVRTGIDMAKSLVLGAVLCGMARPFLDHAGVSVDRVETFIERIRQQFKTAMFLLGTERVNDLVDNSALLLDTL